MWLRFTCQSNNDNNNDDDDNNFSVMHFSCGIAFRLAPVMNLQPTSMLLLTISAETWTYA